MFNLFKKKNISTTIAPTLNLTKGDVLDLTKTSYDNIELCAGWDFNEDVRYDLDLFAVLLKSNGSFTTVYYSNEEAWSVRLHGDNTTGLGDGDDEIISITLSAVPQAVEKIVFGLNIFNAGRTKKFKNVKNAYVRIRNTGGSELCRYDLSDDGGDHSAVVVGSMIRIGNTWNFEADGTYVEGGSIVKLSGDINEGLL